MSIFSVANSLINKYSKDSIIDKSQPETIELINSLIEKYPNEEKLLKIKEGFVNINNDLRNLQNLIMKSFI